MAFTETFSDFINDCTPGYAVATVGAQTLAGIFVKDYALADAGIAGFSSSVPALTCAESDVDALTLADGDVLTIDGTNYSIAEIQPDGTGLTVLMLQS